VSLALGILDVERDTEWAARFSQFLWPRSRRIQPM